MRRLLLATSLLLAAPAASQTTYPDPPLFFVTSNVAVEGGMAEVRIIRGSPSSVASSFHITANDSSMMASAMWPADYPTKIDYTVTIQPGQMIGSVLIPLTHHAGNFVDTKIIAIQVTPTSNAEVDRIETPLYVNDAEAWRSDVWKPAPAIVKGGFAQLKVDSDGYPKSEGCCGTVDYTNIYPWGGASEVFRVLDSGYGARSNRKVWHVVKLNNTSRDAWFYEDDLRAVQPAPGIVI
jgi:hypothetical protein